MLKHVATALRMTVAMAVAAHRVRRSTEPDDSHQGREVEEHVTNNALRRQKAPPPGARPGLLAEPGPQRSDRSLRHSSGDALPTLSLPVLAGTSGEAADCLLLPPLPHGQGAAGRKEGGGGVDGGDVPGEPQRRHRRLSLDTTGFGAVPRRGSARRRPRGGGRKSSRSLPPSAPVQCLGVACRVRFSWILLGDDFQTFRIQRAWLDGGYIWF